MSPRPVSAPALTGRSVVNIKAHNLRAVLLTLLQDGPASRVHLARVTGLSTTTMTNLIGELVAQGIVFETSDEQAAEVREGGGRKRSSVCERSSYVRGRPATPVTITPGARCAVGIHFGVDTLRAGMVDLLGNISHCRVIRHPTDMPPAELLDQAVGLAEDVIASRNAGRKAIVGVGVGASGLVDPQTGVNVLAPNLGWRDIAVRDAFSSRLNLPVLVDNNVRAMALAESMFGVGRGVNTLAFVYGRVGVGAGFVMGGQIYRGTKAGAGEIGHSTMIPAGGAPCRCGNSGCLETLVSEPEIVRQAFALAARAPGSILAMHLNALEGRPGSDGAKPNSHIDQVFAAAREGDRQARALLEERGHYMGTALANLVNLINPDMIILGGLFAAGQDLLLPTIEETMRRRSFAGLGHSVALRVTAFGPDVGVVGAASLALDAFFYQQGVV